MTESAATRHTNSWVADKLFFDRARYPQLEISKRLEQQHQHKRTYAPGKKTVLYTRLLPPQLGGWKSAAFAKTNSRIARSTATVQGFPNFFVRWPRKLLQFEDRIVFQSQIEFFTWWQGQPYSRVLQTFLLESHIRYCTTARGLDTLRNAFISGYVTFCKINKFFVNILFIYYWKIPSRVGFGPRAVVWRPLTQLQVSIEREPILGGLSRDETTLWKTYFAQNQRTKVICWLPLTVWLNSSIFSCTSSNEMTRSIVLYSLSVACESRSYSRYSHCKLDR